MALGSTQPLTEMDKRGQCVMLTPLPPPCAVVVKSGNLNFLEPSGPLQACNGTDLPLKLSLYRPITGPEDSRRLRLSDFLTVGT